MSDRRDEVLAAVRTALHRSAGSPPPDEVTRRLSRPPEGPKPTLGDKPEVAFVRRLENAAGTVESVASRADLVVAVERYLKPQGLELRGVISDDELVRGLPWPPGSCFEARAATGDDTLAVVSAFAGVAETGSLVMLSRPSHPTTQVFLPGCCVAVLARHRIVPHLEDVWRLIRSEAGRMPRALNYITGPSRTADVEQTLQMGAHGPRKLHVLLLGD